MSNKDFLICVLLSAFLFFAIRFFWKWLSGGFNNTAVMEWMSRGFSFLLNHLGDGKRVDMVLTDPPYLLNHLGDGKLALIGEFGAVLGGAA